MDIKCRKTGCKYNNHYTCSAKNILVGKGMECKTFNLDPQKEVTDYSRCLFEEAPKYAPHRQYKMREIDCQSCCMFNQTGKCIANGITVNSLKDCPYCITYIRP